jgi:hypothetical protein
VAQLGGPLQFLEHAVELVHLRAVCLRIGNQPLEVRTPSVLPVLAHGGPNEPLHLVQMLCGRIRLRPIQPARKDRPGHAVDLGHAITAARLVPDQAIEFLANGRYFCRGVRDPDR